MTTAAILGIIPGLQATAIAGRAYKMVPTKWDNKKCKANMKPKKFVKGFVDITVGLVLMKPTAKIISGMK